MKFKQYLLVACVFIATPSYAQVDIKTYENNCLTGEVKSCLVSGYANLNGVDTKKNVSKAKTLFNRACSSGNQEACHVLATRFDDPDSQKKLSDLCKSGHDLSCASKALSELEGIDREADVKKGIATAKAACENSGALSCAILADIYVGGLYEQKRDIAKGLNYLEKSCNLKFYASCNRVTKIYSEGKLTKANTEKVLQALSNKCELGDTKSCELVKNFRNNLQ
ncbi:tetratricopeptide repeat protein [Taylorella equigenitalis]|uniref:tetratricopeptide repeat protein n=1 Tax=Taylorella equigenitalis TaxID=29575 RepID=UPI00041C6CAC|nr:SEL1-like repeat protein [Taylorella equigenitalis]ASY29828.1 hypothetical protein B9Z30_00130 [Taylorella equigenitalis]ASY37131.1 sel1 repeat family protein [Taylorella equigenitalis]ASY40121.1 hypothetical protein CAV20_00130 [Taylorella equigenitalis]ASY41556.1 hypothetical protein CA943_00130 [Taylorella equigenitalis]KGK33618.1 hypothetical protein LW90_03215 [Taylorella equigenitalis]